ncbi:alpha/beta-hydrolase [Choiromyces venosus 120613-1]|uniref:Kynurenine formamidase n=1 Tax=Choiromyces venosus 120613-1 TaxID=1336337 RepID=A0A3N4JT71_9PEZI|nr:alpha/beta-hydrolase [Choiromyces venosus 120613-1]
MTPTCKPSQELPYGCTHPLQTLDLYHQNLDPNAYWVIFIHGGVWRDPKMTKSGGSPLIHSLLSKYPHVNAASMNYRLSPHPHYPSNGNVAKHPDHVDDVRLALSFLQERYNVKREKSVLVGHSAGAYMAFQVDAGCGAAAAVVIGVEGIYHLGKLVEEYADYEGFIEGAFGAGWKGVDEEVLVEAKEGGRAVLIHSTQDELLSFGQSRYWAGVLGGKGIIVKEVYDVVGSHDEVLEGPELVKVVGEELRGLEVEAVKQN